jgi:hypothetical protein
MISWASVQSAPPPPCAAPASAAASLRRFLVSAALVLLSLRRSALILSASAIDTIRGWHDRSATSRCSPRRAWDSGMTVAADEARNEGGVLQHVGHQADVEAEQARVACRVIEHGYSSSLHNPVRSQVNENKPGTTHCANHCA